jgi:hypothetical protein
VVYTPPNAALAYVDFSQPVGSMRFKAHLDANYADAQYAFQTEFADVSPTASRTRHVAVKDRPFSLSGPRRFSLYSARAGPLPKPRRGRRPGPRPRP